MNLSPKPQWSEWDDSHACSCVLNQFEASGGPQKKTGQGMVCQFAMRLETALCLLSCSMTDVAAQTAMLSWLTPPSHRVEGGGDDSCEHGRRQTPFKTCVPTDSDPRCQLSACFALSKWNLNGNLHWHWRGQHSEHSPDTVSTITSLQHLSHEIKYQAPGLTLNHRRGSRSQRGSMNVSPKSSNGRQHLAPTTNPFALQDPEQNMLQGLSSSGTPDPKTVSHGGIPCDIQVASSNAIGMELCECPTPIWSLDSLEITVEIISCEIQNEL